MNRRVIIIIVIVILSLLIGIGVGLYIYFTRPVPVVKKIKVIGESFMLSTITKSGMRVFVTTKDNITALGARVLVWNNQDGAKWRMDSDGRVYLDGTDSYIISDGEYFKLGSKLFATKFRIRDGETYLYNMTYTRIFGISGEDEIGGFPQLFKIGDESIKLIQF